ncbi:TetR/AcrR family transcriptional regulator [Luteimicrobium sp. NPDC057192]|uniref:TetR/AcrR family transcriptional regulator n=1 Tax=Luteimicrobium sp. NPDC057192 TaxID=3346042 RepID=UPI00364082BD
MPRPRLHDAALRTRLLEVASEVIATSGASALTVRDVAARAETSASAVYSLFGSKEALVEAVRAEAFDRFAAHLARAPRTADPGADLLALGHAYRDSALADPHFYAVMFGGALPGEHGDETADDPTFLVLRDAVTRLGPTGRAATEAALALWGLVHGLVGLELTGALPGGPDERRARYDRALRAAGPALAGAGS